MPQSVWQLLCISQIHVLTLPFLSMKNSAPGLGVPAACCTEISFHKNEPSTANRVAAVVMKRRPPTFSTTASCTWAAPSKGLRGVLPPSQGS